MKNKLLHFFSAIIVVAFLFLAYASKDNSKLEKQVAGATALSVSPRQLMADYEANEVAADQQYKDKVLLVSGIVTNIGKDVMGEIYVTLSAGDALGGVQCSFSESHTQEAARLSKGQRVTIKGMCKGKVLNVLLGGCILQ